MLSDFLLLEAYYDTPDTVQIYENMTKKYGKDAVKKAMAAGYIVAGQVSCFRETRGLLFWLTDKGRKRAFFEEVRVE